MWAATQLFDLLSFPEWLLAPSGVALFVAALGVLAKPSAPGRVLLMCVISLIYLYVRSPITANHVFFEGFVNLAILLVVLHNRQFKPEGVRSAVAAEAVPVLRGLLLSLYFFAFFHKLNWDFLSPITSCAGFMLEGIAGRFELTLPGGPWQTAAVWITLLAEGGIFLLLLSARTRLLAMLLAWPFHFALTFHPRPGIYGFSAMLFAMLTLFLPPGFYARLRENAVAARVIRSARSHGAYWRWFLMGAGAGALVVAAGLWLSGVEDINGTQLLIWVRRTGMLLWIPYAMALLAALLAGWPGARVEESRPPLLRAYRSPAVAVLALFVLNGMAPYLGFQTVRTMSMFSNIRTEGQRTNHILMPSAFQIAGYQDDLVRPVTSSDVWLDFYADNQSLLPFTELRRRVWEHPQIPVQVTYERAGRMETLDTSQAGAARQVPPLPFPLHKILAFREVDQDGLPLRCLW